MALVILDGVSKFALASMVLSGVAFLLHLIGYGAPNWYDGPNYNEGLWKFCNLDRCENFVGQEGVTISRTELEAAQAFETLAFLVLLAILILFGLKLTLLKDKRLVVLITMVLQFLAVGLMLIGVIMYASYRPGVTYGFAFALVIVASIISLVAGIFHYLDYRTIATNQ